MFFIHIDYYFFFMFLFYLLCIVGIFNSITHFIILLIFIDLLILINIILFVSFTVLSNYSIGFVYGILLIGVAATDTAVGLGLFILYFKTTNKVSIL